MRVQDRRANSTTHLISYKKPEVAETTRADEQAPAQNHAAAFKAKVVLAAIKCKKTLAELAEQFDSIPTRLRKDQKRVFRAQSDESIPRMTFSSRGRLRSWTSTAAASTIDRCRSRNQQWLRSMNRNRGRAIPPRLLSHLFPFRMHWTTAQNQSEEKRIKPEEEWMRLRRIRYLIAMLWVNTSSKAKR